MNIHKNAKLTPFGRALIVERHTAGDPPSAIAVSLGVSVVTVYKWLRRFREEGEAGLADRSSRPHRLQTTESPEQVEQIKQLRHQRLPFWRIAAEVGLSPATVARRCCALGLSRLPPLNPPEPIVRYEREAPGDMIHIDIKKLGRIDGIGHRITADRRPQRSEQQARNRLGIPPPCHR